MKLYNEFCATAARNANKLAIIEPNLSITYTDVLRLHAYFERALAKVTPHAGAKVAFHSQRYEFYLAMMFTASRHGLRLYFVKPSQLTNSNIEFDWYISDQDVKSAPPEKFIKIQPAWFKGKIALPLPIAIPKQEAVFVFNTSGSTGNPKLYPVPETDFIAAIKYVGLSGYGDNSTKNRIYLAPAPTMRWTQSANFRALLRGGSVFTLPNRRENIIPLIDKFRIDTLGISPALADEMLALPDLENYCDSIKHFIVGGAYVSPTMMEELAHRTGARVCSSYGSTEVGRLCSFEHVDGVSHEPNFLGNISPNGFDIAYFDDDLKRIPDADEGIMGIKNEKYMTTTAFEGVDDTENARSFVDGYFITGDIVRRDGDGLYLVGRSKNIINAGGNKFSLERIELAIDGSFPNYRSVAMVEKNPNGIEELWLYYTGAEELGFEKVHAVLKSDFKGLPLTNLARLDSFPLNDRGKILKAQLRQMI